MWSKVDCNDHGNVDVKCLDIQLLSDIDLKPKAAL